MIKSVLSNKFFWLFTFGGIITGGLLIWWLIDLPILLLLFSIALVPFSFYYTQVEKTRIERGAILSWLTALCMLMVTMWVYEFFDWPATILQVLLLNIQVIMTAEAIFMIGHYMINLSELLNFLHVEIFICKIISIIIAILAPMAAYHVITYGIANTIGAILLSVLWLRISYEIVSMRYA